MRLKSLIKLYWPAISEAKDFNRRCIVDAIKGIPRNELTGHMKCLHHMVFSLCKAAMGKATEYKDVSISELISSLANSIDRHIMAVCKFLSF